MIFLLGFSFLAGLITIITPCMWPMLPIVLSANIKAKDHRRPLGITLGVMTSFAIFTLSISYLVRLFHFDPNILRVIAVIVIIIMGLSLVFPTISRIVEKFMGKLAGIAGKKQYITSDFKSGFLTGLILGIIWSPCGGPILASIAAIAATGMVNLQAIFVTLAYIAGVGIPLFLFTYGGQKVVSKTRFLSSYTGNIQKIFGVIMITVAIAIYFNYDQLLQVKILEAFPRLGHTLNGFESSNAVTNQLNALQGKLPMQKTSYETTGLLNANYPAPEFTDIAAWLNTNRPLTMKELRGKVVLVDFWTYTCINCIRTLPFVASWYNKYKNQGFIVIGIHTPEFQFEHDKNNVLNAINMYNIRYPVAQDNDYSTWLAYNNEYWPTEYLIDPSGNVRRTHFGEGEYDRTEKAIRLLLARAGKKSKLSLDTIKDQTPHEQISPETYLGSRRMQFYYPSGQLGNGEQNFTLSDNPELNSFSYGGAWNITDEDAIAGKNAVLNYNFLADKVYIILRPDPTNKGQIKVLLDGKTVDADNAGQDVENGILTAESDRLYNIIDLHGKTENHLLKIEFLTPGIKAYTFTFG